jgi:hypothetical protein
MPSSDNSRYVQLQQSFTLVGKPRRISFAVIAWAAGE